MLISEIDLLLDNPDITNDFYKTYRETVPTKNAIAYMDEIKLELQYITYSTLH